MIPVNRPMIDIRDYIAFIRGHFEESVPVIENEFSQYVGMRHALFTNSCRSALYLVYKALKLDGEIIVPPLTCSTAILPIICCGLEPHFVDIDPNTYNINPEEIKECITTKTCAIQIIHLAGNPCDMRAISEIAEDHKLMLIEDCAQSLGAIYQGKKIGSFGDASCFSFMKNVYGIGGGMIVSNNKDLILNARNVQQNFPIFPTLLNYYRLIRTITEKKRDNFFGERFYNMLIYARGRMVLEDTKDCHFLESALYNPTNLESSIALSQIKKLDDLLKKRVENALLLNSALKKSEGIKIQTTTKNSKHVFTKYMLETKYDSMSVIQKLHEKGIDAKHLEYKHGVNCQKRFDIDPFYNIYNLDNCNNYLKVHDHIVSLPISPNMTEDEILFVAKGLIDIIENMDDKFR